MKKLFFSKRLAFYTLVFFVHTAMWGQYEMIDKSPLSTDPLMPLPRSIILQDRFGNSYHPDELKVRNIPPVGGFQYVTTNICNAGMFKLNFVDESTGYGFDSTSRRQVICEVFKDISRLIQGASASSAYINILVASDSSISSAISSVSLPSNVDIVGTSFEPIKYGLKNAWMDNLIYTSIKNGQSGYINLMGVDYYNSFFNYVEGVIIVNFKNKQWYTNFRDTAGIAISTNDLYTHTLHQVLHMLGISSNIKVGGGTISGNNLYSRFDNFLYKNTSANKLFTYSTSTKTISISSTISPGCSVPNKSIFQGNNTTALSIYNDAPLTQGINLNHISCSGSGICNTSYSKPSNTYVMVPCLGSGQTYIKRHPHQNEVYVLCDLGYKLRSIGGVYAYGDDPSNNISQGNVYTTYNSCSEPCIAVGGHDTIMMDTLRACTLNFNPKILSNDVPTTSMIQRMELLDSSQGVLTYTSSAMTFTPNPNFKYGEVTIAYFPQCNTSSEIGNVTYITIIYPNPPVSPCTPNGNCNYICYGTFEQYNDPIYWSNFNVMDLKDVRGIPNSPELFRSQLGTTCLKTLRLMNYFGMCNASSNNCWFKTKGLFPPVGGENQFYGMVSVGAPDFPISGYLEGIYFKLKQPIYRDTTKQFKLVFQARLRDIGCPAIGITVRGDDSIPRPMPNSLFSYSGMTRVCNQFCDSIGSTSIGSSQWTKYSITLGQPMTGDSFTYIVIHTERPPEGVRYGYFDNFELYDANAPRVKIASNPYSTMPCTDTSQMIAYYICMENLATTNADSIRLHIALPYGLSIDTTGSDFNKLGNYTIPIGTISNTVCDTLKLKYHIDYTKVSYNEGKDIVIGYDCNTYCKNSKVDVVRIYPQNNAVTVTKTSSKSNPSIGDTISFTIQICNNAPSEITDLEFRDTLPMGYQYLSNTGGLTYSGGILTGYMTLDSAFQATPYCTSFKYTVLVSSTCAITNRAYLSSAANPCFRVNTQATTNSGNTSSIPSASISPQHPVWCGNATPLKLNISNPSGSYTYQWYRNDTIMSGATNVSYIANQRARYSVRVTQGGCTSVFILDSLDDVLSINSSHTNPKCTTLGQIVLSPNNGTPPYTYSWAGSSATTAIRTGLSAGSYLVTVTDSIGCSKTFQFNLTASYDSIRVVKSTYPTKCFGSTGTATLVPLGGTAPYSYLWSDGVTLQNRTQMSQGYYGYTITDANGCTSNAPQSYVQIGMVSDILYSNPAITTPACTTATGQIILYPQGGSAPYRYQWNTGDTTATISQRTVGNYMVTITDSNLCVRVDTIVLSSSQRWWSVYGNVVYPLCQDSNGSITLYTAATNLNWVWNDGVTTMNRSNLKEGVYTVSATDANGCSYTETFHLTSYKPIVNAATSNPICASTNGSIQLSIHAGIPPYTVSWSSGGGSSLNRTNLGVGTYIATITDSIGCVVRDTIVLYRVDTIRANLEVSCPSGNTVTASVVVLKGSPAYTYTWSPSGSGTSITISNITTTPNVSVTITDANNCTVVASKSANMNAAGNVIGTGTSYTNSTQLIQAMGTSFPSINFKYIDNKVFRVKGNFYINTSLTFFNCDFIADSGARIIITNDNSSITSNMTSFGRCRFFTCGSLLWKGIVYNQNYNFSTATNIGLNMHECMIADALYGIDVINGDISAHQTRFHNNFIGIMYRGNVPVYTYDTRTLDFVGNGLNTIKDGYPSIGNDFFHSHHQSIYNTSKKSYCGQEFNNLYWAKTSEDHSYRDLLNGVVFYNVGNAYVEQPLFQNMVSDPSLNSMSVNYPANYPFLNSGVAIFMNNQTKIGSNGVLNIEGRGWYAPMIDSAKIGVVAIQKSTLKMERVLMDHLSWDGVYVQNMSHIDFMQNNIIHAKEWGVEHYLSIQNPKSHIINNTFHISKNVGIGLYQAASSTATGSDIRIDSNQIYLSGNAYYGIDASGIQSGFVSRNNIISFNNPNKVRAGIYYENCKVSEEFNHVTTPLRSNRLIASGFASPVGIYYNFTEGIYKCNTVDNMKIGIRFTGICNNSQLLNASIGFHDIGLKIDSSATVANQVNNGNTFNDTCNFQARSDQSNANLTRFFVNTGAASKFWASPRHPTTPQDLFQSNASPDKLYCVSPMLAPPSDYSSSASLRDQIRLALLEYDGFEPSMLWQNQAWLLETIAQIADTLSDTSAEYRYRNAMDSTNVAKFLALSEEERGLYERTLAREEQIRGYQNAIQSQYRELDRLNATQTDTMTSDQSLAHLERINTSLHTIASLDSLLQIALEWDVNQIQQGIENLAENNLLIVPNGMSDYLQQTFQRLYYASFAVARDSLSAAERDTFRYIAQQCPLFHADVVYRSRILLQRLDSPQLYDDAALCAAAGIPYKRTQSKTPLTYGISCSLAPNPAKESTAIYFSSLPEGRTTLAIYDMVGKKLYAETRELNSPTWHLKTNHLPNGMYQIHITLEDNHILHLKLEIDK